MIVFGWLSLMLLIGVLLRSKVPLLQRFLFPSCLIGGVSGLILRHTGIIPIDAKILETYAYHFFNISFISVGLTAGKTNSTQPSRTREYAKGAAWMALVQGACFGLQASLSGLLFILLGFVGYQLFPTFGFLVPLGFEEGPGQALSVGKVWEGFGFANAGTIGLTFAAIILWGFFFIVGLMMAIFIRWLMTRLGWEHLISPGVQRRVTGWAVDFLIVATVAAIQLTVVWQFLLPISVMGLANGILTTLLVFYLGRRLPAYSLARTAAVYGAVTGTVSSGLLLLRIADPDFKTPVAIEIAIMNVHYPISNP